MATLITLDEFKDHARITWSAEDADLQLKLDVAEELVLDYVNQRRDDDAADWEAEVYAWTPVSAPQRVRQAILLMATELYRFRGDDPATDQAKRGLGELPPAVTALLYRLRDPAVS